MNDISVLASALADHYAIERELGAGGMATVYLARDLKHDRLVALKVLRPELGAVLGAERFLAEIRITAKLDHPHILTLIDSGEAGGLLYYVLPFIRGESLRETLNREQQLGLQEALTITRQVASALDHAHKHGVVHRDIKPENILLHEGEAMLADFGIALAVKEAGGNRLTETGLSLGTPQYMSPEQATGDRLLSARSDVYSLAAVLYEMLAGEPPVTGPTAQSMIAKLMTERPTSLRIVRDTVPEAVDAAVAKALSKVPADRYASAGDFMHALELAPATPAAPTGARAGAPARRRMPGWAWVAAGIAAAGAMGALVLGGRFGRPAARVTLSGRTQLTFSGGVTAPSISPDGKQLAYFTKSCAATDCTYALEIQDVGGTATRRVLEGMTAVYGVSWSPDRRNFLLIATINGRWGGYLVSAVGGTPRYLGPGGASFLSGGDSLLLAAVAAGQDTVFWLRVQTLDGANRDSIRVTSERPAAYAYAIVVPQTRWLVSYVQQMGKGLWRVMDRHGRVIDAVLNSCTCGGSASSDALWLNRAGESGEAESVVRIGLDSATGKLSARQDTVYSGIFSNASVTADGTSFVVDEGTYQNNVWALDLADALRGRFTESQRAFQASTPVFASPSPDGTRLLIRRTLPAAGGRTEDRLTIRPFAGGAETALNTPGAPLGAFWADADHIAMSSQKGRGLMLSLLDVHNNTVVRSLELPDSTIMGFEVLPDGWAYVPNTFDRVVTLRNGQRREEQKPVTVLTLFQVFADRNGGIFVSGWNSGTNDSVMTLQVPMDGSPWPVWSKVFAERGWGVPLSGGGLLVVDFATQESATVFRVPAPGRLERLGVVPRPIDAIAIGRDGRRATVLVRDYHGDAWLHGVVRSR